MTGTTARVASHRRGLGGEELIDDLLIAFTSRAQQPMSTVAFCLLSTAKPTRTRSDYLRVLCDLALEGQ